MSFSFIRAKNSLFSSDRAYWFLRELQHLLEIPASDGARPRVTPLRDVQGHPLFPRLVVPVPGKDLLLLALSEDRRQLVFLEGQDALPLASMDLGDIGVVRVLCTQTSLYLLARGGILWRIKLHVLLPYCSRTESLSSTPRLSELPSETLHCTELGQDLEELLVLATQTVDGNAPDLLLLSTPDLKSACLVRSQSRGLSKEPFSVNASPAMLKNLNVTAACGSIKGDFFIFNGHRGQILQFNPRNNKPSVKVVAGDGVLGQGRTQVFGEALKARLQATSTLIEFNPCARLIDELAMFARIRPETDGDYPVQSILKADPFRTLLQSLGFLIAHNRDSGALVSISCPHAIGGIDRLSRSLGARVLPITSMPSAVPTQDVAIPEQPFQDADCCLGPESSVAFWRRQQAELTLLQPHWDTFLSLRQDKARMAEAEKLIRDARAYAHRLINS